MSDTDPLRIRMEDAGIEPDKVDEILDAIPTPQQDPMEDNRESVIAQLRSRMDDTDDWRLKASLAARIISLRIE